MASYNNDEVFALGMTANNYTEIDWSFQSNIFLNPVYEGNFEEDIDAIAESIGDDSGYFSNDADSFEASNTNITSYDNSPSYIESKPSVHSNTFYGDVPASNNSNHGSIYNGTPTKSTTHLEKGTSSHKQRKETRLSKTLYHPIHEYDHKTPHKYSSIENDSCPRPLEQWTKTHERHEWIAYQLEQPPKPQSSKRRKTGGRK